MALNRQSGCPDKYSDHDIGMPAKCFAHPLVTKPKDLIMKMFSKSLLVAAALAALSSASASSQTTPQLDGDYKGTLVCAQLVGQATVLRVPMDITFQTTQSGSLAPS